MTAGLGDLGKHRIDGRLGQYHVAVQLAADAQGQFSLDGTALAAGVVNEINPAQIGSRQWISTDCAAKPGRTVNTMRASR